MTHSRDIPSDVWMRVYEATDELNRSIEEAFYVHKLIVDVDVHEISVTGREDPRARIVTRCALPLPIPHSLQPTEES